jgi:hypothetical protein
MPPNEPIESEIARVAVAFASALIKNDWVAAHAMLAPPLRDDWQPLDLKREFDEMTGYWDSPPVSVELASADSERAYVAIYGASESGGTVQEGVYVRVICPDRLWVIDHIVWGRP